MASETPASTVTSQAPRARLPRQELTGVVTSAKMEKTIVVKVTRLVQHRLYTRVMRVSKKFYAHDEKREARLGDTVKIVETRPLSKLKRWRLAEIIRRSTRVN
jgi:small subunit ribosomal protein S17